MVDSHPEDAPRSIEGDVQVNLNQTAGVKLPEIGVSTFPICSSKIDM